MKRLHFGRAGGGDRTGRAGTLLPDWLPLGRWPGEQRAGWGPARAPHREERVCWALAQRAGRPGGRTPAVLPLAVSRALRKTACPAFGHHPCCCCICPETSTHPSLSSCLLFSPALWGVPESLNPFHCSFFTWRAFPCGPRIHGAAGFPCRGSLVAQCEWHRSGATLSGVTMALCCCTGVLPPYREFVPGVSTATGSCARRVTGVSETFMHS